MNLPRFLLRIWSRENRLGGEDVEAGDDMGKAVVHGPASHCLV